MSTATLERRRVRVWFGETAIADQIFDRPLADRYEAAMRRRFAGLKVTSEPIAQGNQAVSTT